MITPRLMPGVAIGKAFVSIEYAGTTHDGRTKYRYHIDIGKKSYSGTDLASGVGGGSLQEGLSSLLSFLSAAGESYGHRMRTGRKGENEGLFKKPVVEWAYQHSDEISILGMEIEETKGLIRE